MKKLLLILLLPLMITPIGTSDIKKIDKVKNKTNSVGEVVDILLMHSFLLGYNRAVEDCVSNQLILYNKRYRTRRRESALVRFGKIMKISDAFVLECWTNITNRY